MSLSDQQWEFLKDVALLIQKAQELEIKLTGGDLYRTKAQQEHYYKEGLSKTMNSQHLKRLAIDFNFFIDGKLTYEDEALIELGLYWESLNSKNVAGMFWNFRDVPHFERKV